MYICIYGVVLLLVDIKHNLKNQARGHLLYVYLSKHTYASIDTYVYMYMYYIYMAKTSSSSSWIGLTRGAEPSAPSVVLRAQQKGYLPKGSPCRCEPLRAGCWGEEGVLGVS